MSRITLSETTTQVQMLAGDANNRVAEVSQRLNIASILHAIQMGYRMACEENGLPVPEFADPLVEAGLEGLKP